MATYQSRRRETCEITFESDRMSLGLTTSQPRLACYPAINWNVNPGSSFVACANPQI
jgi:hypothetical protein